MQLGAQQETAENLSEEERKASSIALLRRKAREYMRGVGIINMFMAPVKYDEENIEDNSK